MSAFSDAVLALSPTSYWPFSGGSPLADSGSAGNTLTATGSPTRVPSIIPCEESAADSAYDFDGSGMYLQAGDVFGFNAGVDFSIAFWLKPESSTFGSGFQRVLSKRDGSPFNGWLLFGSGTSAITFDSQVGGTTDGMTTSAGLDQDEVHFVVFTWDESATELKCYVDGAEVNGDNTFSVDMFSHDSTANFQISGERGANSLFAGIIDDVAVWEGTLLDATQIDALWDAGNASSSAPSLRLVQSNLRW